MEFLTAGFPQAPLRRGVRARQIPVPGEGHRVGIESHVLVGGTSSTSLNALTGNLLSRVQAQRLRKRFF